MALFSRRREPAPPVADERPSGPEGWAEPGRELYGSQRFAEAIEPFRKAVDVLHSNYTFLNMERRQPSPADAWIVDGFVNAVGAARAAGQVDDVREVVREVTHRLRAIATATQRVGGSSQLYLEALARLGSDHPDVDVSDIRWE